MLILLLAILLAFYPSGAVFPVHERGIVIISGASKGIGLSAALALARAFPSLHILAGVRRASDGAAIESLGLANLAPLSLDVADPQSMALALRRVAEVGMALNMSLVGLVNNAGVARGPTVLEFHGLEDASEIFRVNVLGALHLTQLCLPLLRSSGGRVVMISSVFGALAPPMGGVYSASKFALEALADALRRETVPWGLSVSVVRPGAVLTPIFATLVPASIAAARKGATEAARTYTHLHTPKDEANELKLEELAAQTRVTDDAITHALTSPRPKTRYTVANILGVPSGVLTALAWLLPDRMMDFVMTQKG